MRAALAVMMSLSVWFAADAGATANMEIGYNSGWIGYGFQTYLTTDFNVEQVKATFRDQKAIGGSIVRLWIFENRQGMNLARYAPQTSSVDQQMLKNIETINELAAAAGLRVYWTLLDGNTMPGSSGEMRDYFYNLLNNKYGEQDAFNKYAVLPVLEVLAKNPNAIYALDLMNEIQAPIHNDYFTDSWNGPRRWMKTTRDFVKANAPWLRVTSSSGWGWGQKDMVNGLFSGLGFDFLDIHIYDNRGDIARNSALCSRAQQDGIPLILGEFGQENKYIDDNLQVASTRGFLTNARNSCITAALAWRFDSTENFWRFQNPDGSFRPAAQVMKSFAGMSQPLTH